MCVKKVSLHRLVNYSPYLPLRRPYFVPGVILYILFTFLLIYGGWGLGFWGWGLGLCFWGFQLIGFCACDMRPSGFLGLGLLYIPVKI